MPDPVSADPPSDDTPSDDDPACELPPLDGDADEAEGATGDDPLEQFARALGDESEVDLDDETAEDLDVGVQLGDSDRGPDDNEVAAELDVGALITFDTASGDSAEDRDTEGPVGFDLTAGVTDLPDFDTGDDAEGADEDVQALMSDELPPLDSDDEEPTRADATWEFSNPIEDEDWPPWHPDPWMAHPECGGGGQYAALASDFERIVAGGTALCQVARSSDTARPLSHAGGRIRSLALVGTSYPALFCSTVLGALTRTRPPSAEPEPLDSWREAAGVGTAAPDMLDLCAGTHRSRSLLARTQTGRLLRSADAGATWRRVELGGPCSALANGGSHVAALATGRSGPVLCRSTDSGLSWTVQPLGQDAARVARCRSPLLVAHNDVVVLAEHNRICLVSSDGGVTFLSVPGCSSVTCATAGEFRGCVTVWAALYLESDDKSELCTIDPSRAVSERIAAVHEAPHVDAADESAELGRVHALAWDPIGQRLWAAGDFGLTSYSPAHRSD